MDEQTAVRALAALAHPHRLDIFRALLRAGRQGAPAGVVAARLGIGPTSFSFHVKELVGAGLVRSERRGRNVIYAADIDGMAELMEFLSQDCCGGNPQLCAGLPVREVVPEKRVRRRAQ